MNIELQPADACKDEVKALFSEYTDMLIEGDSSFKRYLDIRNYDEELEHLEHKYSLPYGRLYLAYYEGALAGCIGLRKIDAESCEMKKAFTTNVSFRGESNAVTWLCAIARNLFVDEMRRQAKRAELIPSDADADSGVSVEREVEDKDVSYQVHQALRELEAPY